MLLSLLIPLQLAFGDPGSTLPSVPSLPLSADAPLADDPIADAKHRYAQGDNQGAQAILEPYVASPSSWKHRTAARLLLGRVYMELGHYNLASSQFYRVRRGEGGDAKVAAWYEAMADLRRHRPHAAIRECEAYIKKYKTGRRVSECMVVIGDAEAARGRLGAAKKAYQNYLDIPEHKRHLRNEEMALRLAIATSKIHPKRSVPLLISLALNHTFAATEAGAMAALQELEQAGHSEAVIPSDPISRMALANSVRRSGWADRAWAMFTTLQSGSAENPKVAAWVEANGDRFARSTRHYLPRILANIERYNNGEATGPVAWSIFEGWRNTGDWKKASEWGEIGLEKHAKRWPWRGRTDDVAHTIMLSGDYPGAVKAWDRAIKARHGSAKLARFNLSLSSLLADDFERADAGFSTLIDQGGTWEFPSRYWRIRTREAANQTNTMADRTAILARDPTGWYRLMLNQEEPDGEDWVKRDGTWSGPISPTLPEIEGPDAYPGVQVGIWPSAVPVYQDDAGSRRGLITPTRAAQLSLLRWPFPSTEIRYQAPEPRPVPTVEVSIPDGATRSVHYDPVRALKKLQQLGERHKDIWPDLLDAHHLASAGLLDESGPIVRAAYSEFRKPSDIRNPDRQAAIRALNIPKGDWEAVSRVAGDHYFSAKHVWEVKTKIEADELGRLQYPIAFGRELWPHCQRWNLDPYLVLAIMRQESIYNPDALSHTGAIGLMQFIKGTGAKVSAMLNEPFFSPQSLYNPSTNLRYSVYYLRILNDRFGGNFPIAVASYNGGPHHMSRAHRETFGDLKLDAFVEFIPRKEPRDYVKKVIGNYQRYVELYGPPGAKVMLPEKLTVDNKDIVNF